MTSADQWRNFITQSATSSRFYVSTFKHQHVFNHDVMNLALFICVPDSVCVCVLLCEAQLEAALGVFYAPPTPLSDAVILEYREPISKYARRFFHHLLR